MNYFELLWCSVKILGIGSFALLSILGMGFLIVFMLCVIIGGIKDAIEWLFPRVPWWWLEVAGDFLLEKFLPIFVVLLLVVILGSSLMAQYHIGGCFN